MINVETYFAYLKCISILPVCTIANRKDRIHYLLKSYLFIINVIPLTYTKCISHYTIYIHKTYLIKSVCQMYLHLAIFRHRGQFLSSDSREAETAKIRKLDRTLNIIDLIYKPEHFLSLSLSLYAVAYFSFTAARFQPDTLLPVGDYPSPAATTTSFTEDPDEEGSLK